LSNLDIGLGGAAGADRIPRSFRGDALAAGEMSAVPIVQRLFNMVVPGAKEFPGPLKRMLWSDIEVNVHPAPRNVNNVSSEVGVITIGSPAYNGVSRYVEDHLEALAYFENDYSEIHRRGTGSIPICSNTAFVQRVVDQATGDVVFYLAGMDAVPTRGAVHFLATNWHHLDRRFPGSFQFCVVIRVTSTDGSRYEEVLSFSDQPGSN
jgi:hypothetical protein